MRGKNALATAALVNAAALVTVPLTAASSVDTKLQVGYSLRLFGVGIGPGGTAGTFIASGAVRDSGTVTGHSTVTPFGNGDDGRLEGAVTLVSGLGTITEDFVGIAGPLGAPHTAAQGTFRIVGGTGAYVDIQGEGTFHTVADFSVEVFNPDEPATVCHELQKEEQ
jgi:hypothetical protein